MVSARISAISDFAVLGARWRELEQRSDGSFFQSWTWVGCLAHQRFSDAILIEATDEGRIVALGLFNRVRRRFGRSLLFLGESGISDLDCPYVEQNGLLTEAGREVELTAVCLRKLTATHDVVLSAVGPSVRTAALGAAGLVLCRRVHASPFADLAAARGSAGDYLAVRSANTRRQLRRSDRFFERHGPITVQRANSVQLAHAMLDQMAALHQAVWETRGKPGSFARPFFRRFHRALIEDGLGRGEIALLKISCGPAVIGFLYNFVWRTRMLAYQSGFVYPEHPSQAKPGLTCHLAAIRYALSQDLDTYDFLAGDDRYKRSLADQSHPQFWLEAGPLWSPRLLPRALIQGLRPG